MDTVVKWRLPFICTDQNGSQTHHRPVGVATQRVSQWSRLVGFDVEVRLEPGCHITGRVDDAMPDSSLLWLIADGGGRRTVEKAEGHEVWLHASLPKFVAPR